MWAVCSRNIQEKSIPIHETNATFHLVEMQKEEESSEGCRAGSEMDLDRMRAK
jgi:hypothetical protein